MSPIPSEITAPYQDPALAQAAQDASAAGSTYQAYQTAASLLPEKLKQALQEKVDYNRDIIDQKNKAQANYFAAPSAAREQYQGIFNPFSREALVSKAVANAYVPYQSLTDILAERKGALSDVLNSGVAAFNSSVKAAGGAYQSAQKQYENLLSQAGAASDLGKWWYEQTHARPSSAGGGLSGLGDLLGLLGLGGSDQTSSGPTLTDPSTGQTYQYDSESDPDYIADRAKGWLPEGGSATEQPASTPNKRMGDFYGPNYGAGNYGSMG